ncbi:MAG: hypothetical protein RL754_1100 [Bacteroidota bacterium]
MFVSVMSEERRHTELVQPLQSSTTVAEALERMDEMRLAHLPFVDEQGMYRALIKEDDLYNAEDDSATIDAVFNAGFAPAVMLGTHAFDMLEQCAHYRISVVPVIDEQGKYVKSVIWSDLIEYFRDSVTLKQGGAIVVARIEARQYSVLEIAGSAEHNDARILGLWLAPAPTPDELEVTIKLNVQHTSPIVQSMQRYGYEVIAIYGDKTFHEDYQERYDHLMNYLKY